MRTHAFFLAGLLWSVAYFCGLVVIRFGFGLFAVRCAVRCTVRSLSLGFVCLSVCLFVCLFDWFSSF
jgi:hypothetical protein